MERGFFSGNEKDPFIQKMINWVFSRFTEFSAQETAQLLELFFCSIEIEEYQKFKISKRQMEWLASRLIVKQLVSKVLSSESDIPLNQICIRKESSGVPYVEIKSYGRVGWLSISHSQGGVLTAFSQDTSIRFGVDLEHIETRPLDLFADYFTLSEIAWISAGPNVFKDLHANLVWSAKEAFLKAIEIGLQMDTRKINIHPIGEGLLPKVWNAVSFSVEGFSVNNWQLLFSHNHEYVMTICLPEGQQSQLKEVEFPSII